MRYRHLPDVGAYGLPELEDRTERGNQSSRRGDPILNVWLHHWGGGTFAGVCTEFETPSSDASSHIVYAGEHGADAGRCAQLVPWHAKAWTEKAFNGWGISIECADAIWNCKDPDGFARTARIVAFIVHAHELPHVWVRGEALLHHAKGICRHADGGAIAGGHTVCPTADVELWKQFLGRVADELHHGGFRHTWGK